MPVRAQVRKGKHIIKMCTSGKDESKKLLERSIAEFQDNLKASKDSRSVALITNRDAVHTTVDVLYKSLPLESWKGCEIDDKSLEQHAGEMEDGEKALQGLYGLWLTGAKEGTVYAGTDAQALPWLRLQITGGKMVLCGEALELSHFFETTSLPDIRQRMMSWQAKSIPDALELQSLSAAFVRTGDLLWMPAGYVMVEKCVHDNDCGLRLIGRHVADPSNASLRFVTDQMKVKPQTELFLKGLPEVDDGTAPGILERAAMKAEEEGSEEDVPGMAHKVVAGDGQSPRPKRLRRMQDHLPDEPLAKAGSLKSGFQRSSQETAAGIPAGKAGSLKWRLQKLSEAMGPADPSAAASDLKAGSLKWRLQKVSEVPADPSAVASKVKAGSLKWRSQKIWQVSVPADLPPEAPAGKAGPLKWRLQKFCEVTSPADLPPEEAPVAGEVPDEKAGSLKWRLQKLSEAMGPADPSAAASDLKAGSLKWRLQKVSEVPADPSAVASKVKAGSLKWRSQKIWQVSVPADLPPEAPAGKAGSLKWRLQKFCEVTSPADLPPEEAPVAGEVPDEKAGSLKWRLQKLSEVTVPADPSAVASQVKAGSLKWRFRDSPR